VQGRRESDARWLGYFILEPLTRLGFAAVLGIFAAFREIRILTLDASVLIAVSELTPQVGVPAVILFVLLDSALALILIFGWLHLDFSLVTL
jgi:hypothetical protein